MPRPQFGEGGTIPQFRRSNKNFIRCGSGEKFHGDFVFRFARIHKTPVPPTFVVNAR
jgi:hypothetical protein